MTKLLSAGFVAATVIFAAAAASEGGRSPLYIDRAPDVPLEHRR